MDSYGFPNPLDKENTEANIHNPDTTESTPPLNNGNTENNSGNFGTGNFNNGYSYGYPYDATITSDYGYSYSAEDLGGSDYSFDANPEGEEYQNPGSSYYEYSDSEKEGTGSTTSENPDGSEEPSSEDGFKHMVDIMKAALPHLDSGTQESANLIIRASELMESLRTVRTQDRVSTFSLHRQNIDIEALLNSIRTVCYARERQLIDNVLNFLRMKNMFDTYSTLSSMMSSSSDNTGAKEEQTQSTENTGGGNGFGLNSNMMDILSTMLSPEQKSTFDNMSMMLNMMQQQ